MGAKVSVKNETPYTWYYSRSQSGGFQPISSGCRAEYDENKAIHCYIYLRYQNHSWNSFSYEFNSNKGNPTFTLRESYDRSCIQLFCSTERNVPQCQNYGKLEADRIHNEQEKKRQEQQKQQEEQRRRQEEQRRRQEEQWRRQEEERRRLERLERERRIQEQIDKESESSRIKLSRASERLREKQSFKGHAHHHERTQVLHQEIEDDAAAIERNEVTDVEEKFQSLLSKYQITEDEVLEAYKLEDRIKMFHNELAIQYCRENKLSMWSQFTFDHAVGYEELSLTEKLTVLEAILQLTLHGVTVTEQDTEQTLGWEKKYDFLFSLVEQLYDTNPTLAEHILLNILDSISELSPQSREILGQLLFNRVWTPTEIMLFIRKISAIECSQIHSILHTAQTYQLGCLRILSSLKTESPLMFLQEQVKNDRDKDADTILRELQEANCPENVMAVLEDVLRYLETELPKYQLVDLNKEEIESGKRKIKSLDLANPDVSILKDVLIGLSIAVQDSSTITTSDNQVIQGYFPRLTQLASLLLLLLSQLTGNKGCLLEIGTGEGKSCILAMFASILAIRGVNVDIVTSSPVLARRDQEEWQKLFQMLGVTSSVVPPPFSGDCSSEEQDRLLQDAYKKQIVYGTVGTFAADTLRQEFEKTTTRGSREFKLVIVDEVDYMTLDNGVQVTFLSHEASGLRHVEQVLANIWTMTSTCQPIEMLETGEIKWATRMQSFHKAATAAVMGLETSDNFSANDILLPGVNLGFFSQEDIEKISLAERKKEKQSEDIDFQDDMSKAFADIMKTITVSQQYDLLSVFEEVLENSVVFECFSEESRKAKPFLPKKKQSDVKIEMLLLEGGMACEMMSEKTLIDVTVRTINSSIRYSNDAQNFKKSDNIVVIPFFLKHYIESQLPVFVENALKAVQMTQGREYMIDISPAAEREIVHTPDKHEYNAIIPVDFRASGVLEKNKKWGNGLQQFLEMKHQLAISPLSSVTNYMSNFHYFKRYIDGNGIFGVSGTLGGDADRDFLARHYETKSYTIPAHRHKKVVELPAMQVKGGNNQWIQTVCETAWKVADRGQVVLVICEDVKTANELHGKMQEGGRCKPDQITLYTISERHNVEKERFCGGRIIIATNLGGRGTDIKVEDNVNESGGLFVLLTHFPRNRRVEKQIFGRTARKGNPGMVQMILNCEHLAPAYQGQPLEIMRQLREEYEINRIRDMEGDELVEINLKEKLFSTFCKFLKDFDKHYTEKERQDPFQLKLSDIPDCFTCHRSKFDYQPALNALKESWALWLTLHEENINRHEAFNDLQTDLMNTMNETSEKLLQGKSDNIYHHIRQAIVRTDLHCRNKSELDYGAKSYWQNVENCDPFYKAVALYNQVYITINLGKGDYKAEARRLLQDAKDCIDVHISEVSNTMVSCNLSVTNNNKTQQTDGNNFQNQMATRMNIFKSWKESIDKALEKLKELEENNSDAITEDCSVYKLSKENSFIVTNEIVALYEYGLGVVFEVKQKPKFCFDALICFILGVVQVIAGVLVCALSFGAASQFGLGLISEGVSDMISGIEGMIKGTFDWASWAISKSISIGISLLTAGFSTIKKAVQSVYKVTKGLLNGTKSFSSVASDFIKSGKGIFTSFKGTVQSGVSSIGKESFGAAMKKMTSSTALQQNFKHAAKFAVQEIGKQAVNTAINHAINAGLEALFEKILKKAFERIVFSSVKENSKLDQTLSEFISSGVPKVALEKDNFKIDQKYEQQFKQSVDMLTEDIIPHLIMDCTTVHEVINRLSEVSNAATDILNKAKCSGVAEGAALCLKVADCTTHLIEMLNAIPTKAIIDSKFVPELLNSISELQQGTEKYDQDGRHNLQDVRRLKEDALCMIAQSVSDAFIKACSGHITSCITKTFKNTLNSATGKIVCNLMNRHKTQQFFDDQRHKHNMKSARHNIVNSLSEEDRRDLMQYTEDISKVDRPATALDIYVLTKSDLLDGKGIRITVVDERGKRLSEEHYAGTNESAGDITLRLTKRVKELHPPKKRNFVTWVKSKVYGEQQLYSGHFDIVQDDGKIIAVNSDNQNCLYHAIAQSTGNKTDDPKKEAVNLRDKVKNEVQKNLESYAPIIKLQREYDYSHKNPGKYAITGGTKKETDAALQEYFERTKNIGEDENMIIRTYHLGFVGKYKSLLSARKYSNNNNGTLNADHIPPKDSIRQAQKLIKHLDPQEVKNSQLYKLVDSIQNDNNGQNLIAMEVLGQNHRQALTSGPSNHSKMSRKLLADTIVSGDAELLLKQCMILHHPVISQKLRADLGENTQRHQHDLSLEGTHAYYKAGYLGLVKEYSDMGIIDQNQRERLTDWVTEGRHEDTNSAEYREILRVIANQNTD
ncbi:uncharacterized protein LOC118802510 [Colossoma macropomum]|uniref:uncharacterized protein LOC118802510 n=1 Tax=Colossoma macropomum TaxID=42526 RepID=UPI0018652E50|nr:uncharacterized protein LOC118802510 [Colossoma macropomum]XP_036418951.1 uncharacterized protein LOC118802510 [Colossoma macropomum]